MTMDDMDRAHQGRVAVRSFQIIHSLRNLIELLYGYAAIIRDHIPKDVKVRYAYYASDNPLKSGQALAAGPMGLEGIRPTYMITKAIISKILGGLK